MIKPFLDKIISGSADLSKMLPSGSRWLSCPTTYEPKVFFQSAPLTGKHSIVSRSLSVCMMLDTLAETRGLESIVVKLWD